MKKKYNVPKMFSEVFNPEQYISACYAIACHAGNETAPSYGWLESEYGQKISHSTVGTSGTCGDSLSNRILTNDNGVITHVQENNSEQGWISGGLDSWIDVNGNGKCDGGDIIYWHTYSGNYDRRWNHWGYAINVDNSRPNHS